MNKQRLLKIARHLEKGELGHERFCFAAINAFPRKTPPPIPECGSAGCAMGEFPIIWPDVWKFRGQTICLITRDSTLETQDDIKSFLNITRDEMEGLFFPESDICRRWGSVLGDSATRAQVAKGIRDFIRYKERHD